MLILFMGHFFSHIFILLLLDETIAKNNKKKTYPQKKRLKSKLKVSEIQEYSLMPDLSHYVRDSWVEY